jgi:hypothetical protein
VANPANQVPAPTAYLAGTVDFEKLRQKLSSLQRLVFVWPDGAWEECNNAGSQRRDVFDATPMYFPASLVAVGEGCITALIDEATIPPAKPTPVYLGDSVRARFEGKTLVLTTDNEVTVNDDVTGPNNAIYLEPETLDALLRFIRKANHGEV